MKQTIWPFSQHQFWFLCLLAPHYTQSSLFFNFCTSIHTCWWLFFLYSTCLVSITLKFIFFFVNSNDWYGVSFFVVVVAPFEYPLKYLQFEVSSIQPIVVHLSVPMIRPYLHLLVLLFFFFLVRSLFSLRSFRHCSACIIRLLLFLCTPFNTPNKLLVRWFFNVHAQIEINYLLWTNVTRFICFIRMYKFCCCISVFFWYCAMAWTNRGGETRYLLLYARTIIHQNLLQSYFYGQNSMGFWCVCVCVGLGYLPCIISHTTFWRHICYTILLIVS